MHFYKFQKINDKKERKFVFVAIPRVNISFNKVLTSFQVSRIYERNSRKTKSESDICDRNASSNLTDYYLNLTEIQLGLFENCVIAFEVRSLVVLL